MYSCLQERQWGTLVNHRETLRFAQGVIRFAHALMKAAAVFSFVVHPHPSLLPSRAKGLTRTDPNNI
jgi:hypothetical protein